MSTSAILSPVTLADVERYAGPFLPAYVAAEEAIANREANGCHLQAAAGRAIHGAQWAAVVARKKRQAYAAAVAEWEASPDSSTRHAVFDAAAASGLACAGCGMIPAACASGDRYGCHPK